MSANYLQVLLNQIELTNTVLRSVTITQELNQHWRCEILCTRTEDQRFPVEDVLGQNIQVNAFDDEGLMHVLFSGFVLSAALDYEVAGNFVAHMTGITTSYLLDLTPRQAYYLNQTGAGVIQNLVSAAGLATNNNVTMADSRSYVQYGQTDFDYIVRIADDHEGWLRPMLQQTTPGILVSNQFQGGPTLIWRDTEGLISFQIRGELTPSSVTGAHYDDQAMQSGTFTGQSTPPFFGSAGQLVSSAASGSSSFPPSYLDHRARVQTLSDFQALLAKESRRSVGKRVVCYGTSLHPDVLAGSTVTISGIDTNTSGTYGVTKVIHHWELPGGYHNEFWCTPCTTYTQPEAPPMARWSGVVPARVTSNVDPDGFGRIQVQFFWQEDGPTTWLRMMTPNAGSDRGILFLPEVGDEVWVAFEDGDPERGRILGCAWNGQDKPPLEQFLPSDNQNNNIKRIVTKSGTRLQMLDSNDGSANRASLILATPNNNRISLFETTNASTETGDAMLVLHSTGDILLSAPNGRVHIHSKLFSREVGPAS